MNWFDRFADWVADQVAHAWFFTLCLGIVVGWLIGLPFRGWMNESWHLLLSSATTAPTFLLVALLHNTQHRAGKATNERFVRLEEHLGIDDPVDDEGQKPNGRDA